MKRFLRFRLLPRAERLSLLLVACITAILCACNKPDDDVIDVLPDGDLLSGTYVDTFTVDVRPMFPDSAFTTNRSVSLLGNYRDPEFGRVSASTFTQFRITGTNLSFGQDDSKLTLDSIVLALDLSGFYGRYDDPQELEVFELTDTLSSRDTLYSNSYVPFDSTRNLAEGQWIDFSGRAGFFDFITIPLDSSLGNKLLHAPQDSLALNNLFTQYFKGLCIRTKPVGFPSREPGAVWYVDLRSVKSGLKLYYKDSTVTKLYTFVVNDNATRYHTLSRSEYSDKIFGTALSDSLNPLPEYGVIQSGALVKTKINIPGLAALGKMSVNRADLILKVDQTRMGTDDRFQPPTRIYLYVADSTGEREISLVAPSASAIYNPGKGEYVFTLTNTIMQLAIGRVENNGMILVPDENAVTVNRALFGAQGHPTLRPRLKVVYTPLPK